MNKEKPVFVQSSKEARQMLKQLSAKLGKPAKVVVSELIEKAFEKEIK